MNTGSLITLHNAENRLMVSPDAGGHISVNGKTLKTEGDFVQIRGVLFVPETLEGEVRALFKPPPEPASQPAAPKALPESTKPSVRKYRIVLDPGHGGEDPGTISKSGLQEKDITLPTAEDLAQLLKQAGFDVVLTRETDVFIDLDDRAAIVNRSKADLFVSIHADAYGTPLVGGYTVYTCREASSESRAAAQAVAEALSQAGIEGTGLREADYRLLVCTTCPGMLVELGYLSNSRDAERLADRAVQAQLARAIADGIAAYFRR
jgi:N-acetylmuramoyl-L-alanine amidase